ncbi:dead end protein homolog 1 isoform X3 [Gallus gallus]|uniref:dead end protein homolog 1 isoform X3 n=1 Tax=Gallus gallus TaxID=9031 RepID=UPI001AE45D11|nr:dead end protein homolog 1 isoform X3 [Gallus gallus]
MHANRVTPCLISAVLGHLQRFNGGDETGRYLQWTSSINRTNKMALLAWVRETGIDLVQVNGQRRYGGPPPGWVGSPPPPGSEVYIAKLPRDLYEDTLIPLFQSVGQLYEFRLMLTFSGLNRGFAYAKYSDQHGAGKAIAALNNWEVQEGRAILVCRSFEKCELSVNGLPATLRRRELDTMLLEATEGLLGLTLHASPGRKQGKVAVLTYSSHRAAAMAKKALVEGNVGLFKKKVKVEWLKPELKEQLQACGEKPPPGSVQCLQSPERVLPSSELRGALGRLGALCRRLHLGTPRFLTRCVQAEPHGWQRYWGQVVIPSYPVPCSTFLWVREDAPGTVGHEKMKEAVAQLALMMLGH